MTLNRDAGKEFGAVHGEVTAQICKNILLHKSFTVAELCADTDLRPDQVYPVLAKLQKSGFISTQKVESKEKRRAHRPIQLYMLSDDSEKRKALTSRVSPFLELRREALSYSEALERVRVSISEISYASRQLPASFEAITVSNLQIHFVEIDRMQQQLEALRDDLEIARYECTRSTKYSLLRWYKEAESDYSALTVHLLEARQRIEQQLAELKAEDQFSEILTRLFSSSEIDQLSSTKILQMLEQEYHDTTSFYVKAILSNISARVRFAKELNHHREPRYSISEASIRFGSDVDDFLKRLLTFFSKDGDVVSLYNLVNAYILVNNERSALKHWKDAMVRQDLNRIHGSLKQLGVYSGATILVGNIAELGTTRLEELESRFGLESAFSAISTSPIEILGASPYVIKATVADWFEPSTGFLISGAMRRQQGDLLAYGPLRDIVQFPGLPRIRLATALVRLGVPVETAWRIAETPKKGKVILVLHTPRTADNSLLGGLSQIFPEMVNEGSFAIAEDTHVAAARAVA